MPSIDSVKAGDIIYPVSVIKGGLRVLARLPVEKKEPAFDYLIRETGRRRSALIPTGVACWENGYRPDHFYDIIHDRVEVPGQPGKYRDVNMFDSPDDLPPGYRIVDATQGASAPSAPSGALQLLLQNGGVRDPGLHHRAAPHPPGAADRAALRLGQKQAEGPALHRQGRCADHARRIHPSAQR